MGSTRDESSLESLAIRFERLWNATGTPPDLTAFLKLHGAASLRERAEVVRVDQRRRWQAGQPRALEEYFQAFPDLAASSAVKVAFVVAEYRTAKKNGRPYDYEGFLARFADLPALRDRLDGPRPAQASATAVSHSPAAAPPLPTRRGLLGEELVVVQPSESDEVYDFVDDDGVVVVEPVTPPDPVSPQPRLPIPVQQDSDFRSASEKISRRWSERALARRAAAWHADPSLGAIPRPWEWVAILLRTDRAVWTRRQKSVMAAAGRFYLIVTLAISLGLIGAGLAQWFLRRTPRDAIPLAVIEPIDRQELGRYIKQLDEIKAEIAANRRARADALLDQVAARWRDWEWRHLKLACHPRTFDITTPLPFPSLLVSSDNRRLATNSSLFVPGFFPSDGHFEGRLRLWGLEANPIRELATFSGATGFLRVALSADGHRVAAATENAIIAWDVDKTSEVLRIKQSNRLLADLALAPDGSQLAVAASDGPITLLKIPGGEKATFLRHEASTFTRMAFAPRGQRLFAESESQIALWDSAGGRQVLLKQTKRRFKYGMAVFSPDGRHLAATDEKSVVRLWNAENGEDLWRFDAIGEGAGAIAFSPDGKELAASVPGGEWAVVLWDTETGRKTRTFSLTQSPADKNSSPASLHDIAFSPDGSRLAACRPSSSNIATISPSVLIWDLKTGGVPETVCHAAQPQFTTAGCMIYSSDAVSPSRIELGVWDPSGSATSLELAEAGRPSPDGTRLVAIASNQIVSTDDGRVLKVLSQIAPVNFVEVYYSPNGRSYVTLDRARLLRFWDAVTDTPLGEGHKITGRLIQFLWSTSGERLITVAVPQRADVDDQFSLRGVFSSQAVISVWDPAKGAEPLATIQGLYHRFGGRLSISPDGSRFAAGSLHETVRSL